MKHSPYAFRSVRSSYVKIAAIRIAVDLESLRKPVSQVNHAGVRLSMRWRTQPGVNTFLSVPDGSLSSAQCASDSRAPLVQQRV